MVVNIARSLLLVFVMLACAAAACAQQPTAVIEHAEAQQVLSRQTVYDGETLAIESETEQLVPIVVVRTTAPSPLVRGYLSTDPFPPSRLVAIGDGRYALLGDPGSRWTIEILSLVDGAIWSEFLDATIGDVERPDPPPPPPPPPPPETDWSHLTELVAGSSQVAGDPDGAAALAAAYRQALEDTADVTSVAMLHRAITEARASALGERRIPVHWDVLLSESSLLIDENPPQTADEYRQIVLAFVRGLELEVER